MWIVIGILIGQLVGGIILVKSLTRQRKRTHIKIEKILQAAHNATSMYLSQETEILQARNAVLRASIAQLDRAQVS